MCGILGTISVGKTSLSEEAFVNGLRCIEHRGPDDWGITPIEDRGFLGSTRLAIIDLSQAGHQPMRYAHDGRSLIIAFNGEIYNYVELHRELKEGGFTFVSGSDTEVIMAAYLKWGRECLDRFNGMFAFAIWDEDKKELFLARDRMGKKPLFFAYDNGTLTFASEIKSLRGLGVKPAIDKRKFYKYLLNPDTHYFGRRETFYSNIESVPAGHTLVFNGTITTREWWSPLALPKRTEKSPEGSAEELRELLGSAVALRLRSDVPVALALSGGMDSSAILHTLSGIRESDAPELHTFTVCHPGRETDERQMVERILKSFSGSPIRSHFFNFPTDISEREIVDFILSHDEPVRNFDVYNQYFLMKKVHEAGIKVLLSGQGADELFWGYPRYYTRLAIEGLRRWRILDFWNGLVFVKRFNKISLVSATRKIFSSAYTNRDEVKKRKVIDSLMRDMPEAGASEEKGTKTLDMFQCEELMETHLPSLLRDEDRNSMRFSVESRAPFLDYRIIALARHLDPRMSLQKGFTKYLIRLAFQRYLPEETIWRKTKSGLYEKRTISYVRQFRELAERTIRQSPFMRKNIKMDRLPLDNQELLWRLFNVAVLDLNHENQLPSL